MTYLLFNWHEFEFILYRKAKTKNYEKIADKKKMENIEGFIDNNSHGMGNYGNFEYSQVFQGNFRNIQLTFVFGCNKHDSQCLF